MSRMSEEADVAPETRQLAGFIDDGHVIILYRMSAILREQPHPSLLLRYITVSAFVVLSSTASLLFRQPAS
jgi:hypothetical protein